ncbi:MAG: TIR domain-containing protein [Dehalococcoidia bacterium]
MAWSADAVEAELSGRRLRFETREIQGGRQFRLESGEIFDVYATGRVVPRGKATDLRNDLALVFDATSSTPAPVPSAGAVFVVYGHDGDERARLEAMLLRWGIKPRIMDQEPATGLTLIEKLDAQASGVSYAIVLMTGDDLGRERGAPEAQARPRARQNVVLELGMFLGKLGRGQVAILYEQGVELPSDIAGLEYLGYGEHVEERKLELAKAMAVVGFQIDLAKV